MTSTNPPSRDARGHDADELHNPDVAHEHSDVNVRQILMFGVGLVTVTVVCALVVRVLFGVLQHQAAANEPPISPLAVPAGELPPEPRLVTNEPGVLKKHRLREAEELESSGWVDEKAGIAHIPIEEAKKALLRQGLPVRAGAPADPLEGTPVWARGESSGGRTIKKF